MNYLPNPSVHIRLSTWFRGMKGMCYHNGGVVVTFVSNSQDPKIDATMKFFPM